MEDSLLKPYARNLALALALSAGSLSATTIVFTPGPGNGPAVPVTVTISDITGGVSVNTQVTGTPTGDIRGLFFVLSGNSIPAGLKCSQVSGANVSGCDVDEGGVNDLGNGANMNGVYTDFDLGVRIGGPGIGGDDIQSTTFLINNGGISATQFVTVGVRLTSVSDSRGGRTESSKLIDSHPDSPVPEPATAGMVGLAVAAGLLVSRRKA